MEFIVWQFRGLLIFIVGYGLGGCLNRTPAPASEVKLINGKLIPESDHPETVMLESKCSATFVSDNTLITAGHCASSGTQLVVPILNNAKSIKVIRHPKYDYTGKDDITVAIFPDGTAKHWLPVANTQVAVGTEVEFIGYGQYRPGVADYKKRYGTNKISSIRNGWITSSRSSVEVNSGKDVSVAPGDSGGTLKYKGSLIGVTSQYENYTGSGHADITIASNTAFLKNALTAGARINFGDGGVGGDSVDGLPLMLDPTPNVNRIFAGGDEDIDSVLICNNATNADQCVLQAGTIATNPPETKVWVSNSRQALGVRGIFGFNMEFIPVADKNFIVVGRLKNGQISVKRAVQFRKKT